MENVNFRQVFQELVDEMGDDVIVAQALGCNRATVYRFRTGGLKMPSWSFGDKVLRLYERVRRES